MILLFLSEASDFNLFLLGTGVARKICLEEYMYRWSWDNAQFDFGSAQAREVLQLGFFWGLGKGRVVWAWFQGKGILRARLT